MMEVQLSQSKVALVDDEDYDFLNQFKWYAIFHRNTFYARTNIGPTHKNRKNIKMHRLVLGLTNPNIIIDHIDGNGLNNQRNNLRICTNSQNQANRPKRPTTASRYKGVTPSSYKNKNRIRWRAQITINKTTRGLGYFDTEEEAARVYDAAAITIMANLRI